MFQLATALVPGNSLWIIHNRRMQVCARFRPVNARERAAGPIERTIQVEGGHTVVMQDPKGRGQPFKFAFDAVIEEDSTQSEAFDRIAGPLIDGIFSGYNSTVFAYGQTGGLPTLTLSSASFSG